MPLAIAATCSGVSRLRVSMPSVSTTTALRCGRRPPPDPAPATHTRGLRDRVIQRRLAKRRLDVIERALERRQSEVNGVTRSRRVSKQNTAASSSGRERAEDVPRRLPRIDRLRSRRACCR